MDLNIDGSLLCKSFLWGTPHPMYSMVVSQNRGSPSIIHFSGIFFYKPSILGIPIYGTPYLLIYIVDITMSIDDTSDILLAAEFPVWDGQLPQ